MEVNICDPPKADRNYYRMEYKLFLDQALPWKIEICIVANGT